MFRYYNYTLIESNRSYSTEKIQKLLKIHPQTIRGWVKEEGLQCVSKKPMLIYGAILKAFIKTRNEKHKKTLDFKEMKCLKCRNISVPKDNQISIYNNQNGSIRAVGVCSNCDNEFSKLYKKNSTYELKNAFFIKPTESTLYNTSPISNKTHLISQKETILNESYSHQENNNLQAKEIISSKTNIKEIKTSSKTHIKTQQTLFDFDYDK